MMALVLESSRAFFLFLIATGFAWTTGKLYKTLTDRVGNVIVPVVSNTNNSVDDLYGDIDKSLAVMNLALGSLRRGRRVARFPDIGRRCHRSGDSGCRFVCDVRTGGLRDPAGYGVFRLPQRPSPTGAGQAMPLQAPVDFGLHIGGAAFLAGLRL